MKNTEELLQCIDALAARLDVVESENASQSLRLAALERIAPANGRRGIVDREGAASSQALVLQSTPRQTKDEGTKVSYPVENAVADPSAEERQQLLKIVLQHYPSLAPSQNRQNEFENDFRRAFSALGRIGRGEEPDRRRYVSYFIDELRPLMGGYVCGQAFLAAALAHGDVPFVTEVPNGGVLWELGLKIHGGKNRPEQT